MACSDYISPSTEQFVAIGSSGSEIGRYESVVDITLPDGVSRGVLAVNLYDIVSDKYEAFTIVVPQGSCTNTNCVVLTKNINKNINIFLLFNNLIKGNRYILNYCFHYNPDVILGTEATPQPTPTETPIQPTRTPTATVDPNLPTSTPTNTPSLPPPTQTPITDLSLVKPPLISANKLFNLNDYDVNINIYTVNNAFVAGPIFAYANSEVTKTFSSYIRAISTVPGYTSQPNDYTPSGTTFSYTIASTNDIFPPIFAGDRIFNNNDFPVYATTESIETIKQFSGPNRVEVTVIDGRTIEPYSWSPYISKIQIPRTYRLISNELIFYRTRFASKSSGTSVTQWYSNTEDVFSGYASKGFGPIISPLNVITAPIFLGENILNNNPFSVNAAILYSRTESTGDFAINATYFGSIHSNVQAGAKFNYSPANSNTYYCIFFIPGACSAVSSELFLRD